MVGFERGSEAATVSCLDRVFNKRSRFALASAATLVLLLLWTYDPHHSWELEAQRNARPPRLLQHMFVCVSFAWNPLKIVYLKQIALRTGAFPTRVDVCIVSNQPARVQTLVDGWRMPHLRVCGTTNVLNPEEQYALLWEHRQVLDQVYQTGRHTMFMYMEDDTDVTWQALESWAADTEVLEPLGFSRHFFRTEVRNDTGNLVFLDFQQPVNLTTWNRTLHLSSEQLPEKQACSISDARQPYWQWQERPHGCAHRHYIQLPSPYYGMWTATRAELKHFIASEYWSKAGALAAKLEKADYQKPNPYMYGNWPWGYPERSTGMIQLLDVPDGFWSRGLLPYDPELRQLLPIGQVGHERNGYRSNNNSTALDVQHFFQPDDDDQGSVAW